VSSCGERLLEFPDRGFTPAPENLHDLEFPFRESLRSVSSHFAFDHRILTLIAIINVLIR
jgi:hypothetical protein